jgi:hypothetical protein
LCNHCHAVKRGQEGARIATNNFKNRIKKQMR